MSHLIYQMLMWQASGLPPLQLGTPETSLMSALSPRPAVSHLMDRVYRTFEHVLVLGLAVMALMVFANVVLRYAFNSGITLTEEVARFIFVWLTFIGAIVALRQGTHLGMDTVVSRLPRGGKAALYVPSHPIIIRSC